MRGSSSVRGLAVVVLFLAAASRAAAAPPDDPLPLRSQLPFNLLFLEPTPRGARLLPARGLRFAFHAAYESTFATNADTITLIRNDPAGVYDGRVTLQALQQVAVGTPGQQAFVLDGETLRSVLEARWGAGDRVEIDLEIPFLLHSSGFLDTLIENYHERLNLPDGGRPPFERNRFIAGYVGDGEEIFFDGPPDGLQPGDVVLGGRFVAAHGGPRSPAVSAETSIKFPTGDPDSLGGSGRTDYSLSFALSSPPIGRSTLHAGWSWVHYGGWSIAPRIEIDSGRSLFATWSLATGVQSVLIVQLHRTTGAFPYREGSDLGRGSTEIALGFRHRTRRGLILEGAFVENLDRQFSSPDVGAFVGIAWRPPPAGRSDDAL